MEKTSPQNSVEAVQLGEAQEWLEESQRHCLPQILGTEPRRVSTGPGVGPDGDGDRAHLGSLVWVPMGTGTVTGGVEEEDEGVRRVRRHLGLPGVGVWLDGAPSLITIH